MSRGSKGCCKPDTSRSSTVCCRREKSRCSKVCYRTERYSGSTVCCRTDTARSSKICCKPDMYRSMTVCCRRETSRYSKVTSRGIKGCCRTDRLLSNRRFQGQLTCMQQNASFSLLFRFASVRFDNRNSSTRYFDIEAKQPYQTFCFGDKKYKGTQA
jgi:hypothetical protein